MGGSALWIITKDIHDESQNIEDSVGSIQQRSRRDAVVRQVINAETVIVQGSGGRSTVVHGQSKNLGAKKEEALRETYYAMIKPLKLLNSLANFGLKNEGDYSKITVAIEEFIETKMKHEIDIETEIKRKLDEVMGAFRCTKAELYAKLQNKQFNEGLHGLKSFDFIMKCKEVTEEIKTRLSN